MILVFYILISIAGTSFLIRAITFYFLYFRYHRYKDEFKAPEGVKVYWGISEGSIFAPLFIEFYDAVFPKHEWVKVVCNWMLYIFRVSFILFAIFLIISFLVYSFQ